MSDPRPRVLVLAGKMTTAHPVVEALCDCFAVDVFEDMDQALEALRSANYHACFADVGDFLPLERALVGEKSNLVLNTIGEGVCIVDVDGRLSWSNKRLRAYAPEVVEQVRRICMQAISIFVRQTSSVSDAARRRSKKFTFQVEQRYFEIVCSPVLNGDNVQQVVAVVWDATSGKRLQGKIDAIDAAGRELAKIDASAVADLIPADRLKLLQEKIIKFSKDLMHFDHFAIRLLNKRSNRLEVVIAEGLPLEATEIDLYAQPEGNGISGYVAATGRSYICHDVEKDPRYVPGLNHCKSSLTVPLNLFGEVLGVYNIESDHIGAFTEDDRQFAEIFGRYVGMALNMLDLLVVERSTITGRITDNVLQEMAQPLNDMVTDVESLKEEYIGDDSMRQRLNRIADHIDQIRQTLRDVAAGPNTVLGCQDGEDRKLEQKRLAGKTILVADDESNIRQTIGDILAKHGATVELCKDGYEACAMLEQADSPKFDLIISDIKMPYRTGYEIFAVAQRFHEGLAVILMTGFGYDPNHSIVRASQEGLSSVLFKPFKVDQLLEAVGAATGITMVDSPRDQPA